MFEVYQNAYLTRDGSFNPIAQSWISTCIILQRIAVGSEKFNVLEKNGQTIGLQELKAMLTMLMACFFL